MKALSNFLVTIPKAYQDEIVLGNGVKLFFDHTWTPEKHVTVIGDVSLVPYKFKDKIKEGDKLVFSYRVVADVKTVTSEEVYSKVTAEESRFFEKYISNKGNTVTIIGVQGKISVMWVGTYVDKNGVFQHGEKGDRSKIDRWLSNFNMNSEAKFIHKNLYDIDGNDYWRVREGDVLAKLTDEEVVPLVDKLILAPIDIQLSKEDLKQKGLFLPNAKDVRLRMSDRARLLHDYEPLGLKKGDVIGFEPKFLEKYEIEGEEVFFLKPKRATIKWQET